MSFYDYDPDAIVTCPKCGFTGRQGDGQEVLNDGYEVNCVRCDKRLGFVDGHVTLAQTQAAAAAGNPRAQASLPGMESREARLKLAEEVELKSYKDLPDLDSDRIRIEYDRVDIDGDSWTVLRHEGEEVWRELAFYDGLWRFKQIFSKLQIKYGRRLAAVEPTNASWLYIAGEDASAESEVGGLNSRLTRLHEG
jgi:hypothetical protein